MNNLLDDFLSRGLSQWSLWQLCFSLLAGAALFSGGLTSLVRLQAERLGIVARRDLRRRHDRETPLLGGVAFYALTVLITLLGYFYPDAIPGFSLNGRFFACFLTALTLVFGVGVLDDLIELKAPPKLAAQVSAAVLMLFAQPTLPVLLQGLALPEWILAALLVLWIVGLTNAMNMIDGLDGLCAGVTGMSAFTMGVIMLRSDAAPAFPVLLAFTLTGACIGFLFHNFSPARIFLGDSGSLTLGFLLAVLSTQVAIKRSLFISCSIPIFSLGLPVLDISLALVRRKMTERSFFQGDRGHLHHRLRNIGLSHRSAVLLLWTASAYFNFQSFLLAGLSAQESWYVFFSVLVTSAFLLAGLVYVESRLAFQASQFSHHFLDVLKEEKPAADPEALKLYLEAQVAKQREFGTPFTVITLDSAELLRQLHQHRPGRMVEFHQELYAILRNRLRETDFICRVTEHRIAAILGGTGEKSAQEVVAFLASQVRTLQESFHVYQSHQTFPEGFRVLHYPRDEDRIRHLLRLKGRRESLRAA